MPAQKFGWPHDDRSLVSERALEVFYGESSSRDVHCPDGAKARARAFDLQPGDGVYMPMGSPHAAETGDAITITFSMLMNTHASMERVRSYEANHKLRKLGLSPAPVGAPVRDFVKRNALAAYRRTKALLHGTRGAHGAGSPWY